MSVSYNDPAPVKPKKNNTVIIVVIVLVVLCCCCLILGGISYKYLFPWLWENGDSLIGTGMLQRSLSLF